MIFVINAFFKCIINYERHLLVYMSNANISLNKNMGFLLIAILSIAVIVGFSQITNVNALNNYFNCTTKKANGDSDFRIQEAFTCYDNVFLGAQKYANETYQNPDINNLTAIKEVAYSNSENSVDTPKTTTTNTTTNDDVTDTRVKAAIDDDKLIKPVKLNDDLKPKDVSKTVPDEEPNDDLKSKDVSKTVPDEEPNVPINTNTNTEKSPESPPDFHLNSDFTSNPESFDLPFSAVIPK